MKVFIIKGDNGENYEDYYEWIEDVYINEENANKRLEKLEEEADQDYKKDKYGLYPKRNYEINEYETKE